MLLLRRFEERCVELQISGEIASGLSVGVGQEAAAASLGMVLGPGDLVFSNHRNHGHVLGRGADPRRVMAEVLGRASGLCGGRAGTWHISAREAGVPISSAIVAAATAQTVGAGLAFRRQGVPQVAVACLGDRSLNEGTMWESLNLAALWKLPVVFLCENNDAFPYDPRVNSGLATDRLTRLVEGFEVLVRQTEGTELLGVHGVLGEAVAHARAGAGPAFVEVRTMRWPGILRGGHHTYVTGPTRLAAAWEETGEGDPYGAWRAHDPVLQAARGLVNSGSVSVEELEALDAEVLGEVDAAVAFARESPWPKPADALTGVFA